MNKVTINGGQYPVNLKALIDSSSQSDYRISNVYSLEIDGFTQSNHAVFSSDPSRIFLTTSMDLLEKVWRSLPPKKSKITMRKFYVHKHGWIGYAINHPQGDTGSTPQMLTTSEDYHNAKSSGGFIWAKEITGALMEQRSFTEHVDTYLSQLKQVA